MISVFFLSSAEGKTLLSQYPGKRLGGSLRRQSPGDAHSESRAGFSVQNRCKSCISS